MPPQLLVLAAIGVGLYAGFRFAARAADKLRSSPAQPAGGHADAATAEPRDLGRLEWDDGAQVYRPRQAH
ncbi:MAG: hypothetical protein NW217_05805 [Hyphomicrobiaceae bacterium]|nr:hypothetical protein [Hyphomicrobiaceae bacterium]